MLKTFDSRLVFSFTINLSLEGDKTYVDFIIHPHNSYVAIVSATVTHSLLAS